jgi:hypothetical protein
LEQIGGRTVALLTGMSGKGHWSASMSPLIEQPGFEFDLALQSSTQPEKLGSSYACAANCEMTRETKTTGGADEHFVSSVVLTPLETAWAEIRARVTSDVGTIEIGEDAGESASALGLVLRPEPSIRQAGAAIRWKYVIVAVD